MKKNKIIRKNMLKSFLSNKNQLTETKIIIFTVATRLVLASVWKEIWFRNIFCSKNFHIKTKKKVIIKNLIIFLGNWLQNLKIAKYIYFTLTCI